MENLHAPTIPSGPTTSNGGGIRTEGLTLPELQLKKEAMEAELRALGGVLESHGVDMTTSLMTPDGFPRADLDVAQIRTTRSRIIHLKNDYKALMEVIEKAVHAHFEFLQANPLPDSDAPKPTTNGVHSTESPRPRPPVLETPFAKVNSVVESSPAEQSGLKAGDLIRNFGYVNRENHDGLKRVAECVQGNEGRNVLVKVSRGFGTETRELDLTFPLVVLYQVSNSAAWRRSFQELWDSKLSCGATVTVKTGVAVILPRAMYHQSGPETLQ
ncbi:hypothetical protein V492_07654 [Pseudogymnoascus sp. VKM F-4246]|nr:hypothetical protein V492_07654 [Pseudogymnoascus sp. VKM F-4246]